MIDIYNIDFNAVYDRHVSQQYQEELKEALYEYGGSFKIDTDMRVIRFLAQSVHEVSFTKDGTPKMRESLWYRNANSLMRLSKYFRRHPRLALKLVSSIWSINSRMDIANHWYANRMGNGNYESGDGWRFRGYGMFQTTGRANITDGARVVYDMTGYDVFDENGSPKNTLKAFIYMGMAYWYISKCYECRDTMCVTNKVNHGLPSIEKRERLNTALRLQRILTRRR
jgi:predicted chitinase